MDKLSPNVIAATGIEMYHEGLFSKNTDDTLTLWVKWRWGTTNNKEDFAPFTGILLRASSESTHVIGGKYFAAFPKNENGEFMFVAFLSKFIDVQPITPDDTLTPPTK